MRNTQGVWILYAIMLILNFLIAEKQRTAAERPGIERGTAEINQSINFRNTQYVLIKELKNKDNGFCKCMKRVVQAWNKDEI